MWGRQSLLKGTMDEHDAQIMLPSIPRVGGHSEKDCLGPPPGSDPRLVLSAYPSSQSHLKGKEASYHPVPHRQSELRDSSVYSVFRM